MATDQPETQPSNVVELAAAEKPAYREVNYEHSRHFVPILQHIKSTLLVSTYAAGKVASVSADQNGLQLAFSNFLQAMGMAVSGSYLAIGGQNIVWLLQNGGSLAHRMNPNQPYDRCYLSREAFVTGNIHCHEMAWSGDGQLWIVNTLFSCLCTLHAEFNFVPRWQPSFIKDLAAEDRCHLNGMAMVDGQPKFVSAMGATNEARGWRENKARGGILIDVPSGEIIAQGLCMPHSPRWHDGRLWVLDSGKGQLLTVDLASGKLETVVDMPGYVRGLAFCGQFAFFGMSRARERSVFGGVPICENKDELKCGVVVLDLASGKNIAYLEFKTGVDEIFDVQVIAGAASTFIAGPYPQEDDANPVWVVPDPAKVAAVTKNSHGNPVARLN